jgi:predicted nucleic acid-binding protein
MKLVVDANILIAALLKKAVTRELLLEETLEFVAPGQLLKELKHLLKIPRIRRRLKLSDEDLYELTSAILSRIDFVPEKLLLSSIKRALSLVGHPEDAPYAGLALALNIPIWSNDVELKDLSSSKIKVLATAELIKLLI